MPKFDIHAGAAILLRGLAPLGVVLVAMLGVGVAEHSGYINAAIRLLLNVTPKMLLTPMLILVAIIVTFLVLWSLFLIGYWMLGIPLGLQASYTYP